MPAGAAGFPLSAPGEVHASLTPFELERLIRPVLRRAEVGDRQTVLESYGTSAPEMTTAQSYLRFEPPDWLPGKVSEQQHCKTPARANRWRYLL